MRKNEGGEKRDEARKGGGSKNRKGVGRGGDGGGKGMDGWMCLGVVPVPGWGDLWARHRGETETDGL